MHCCPEHTYLEFTRGVDVAVYSTRMQPCQHQSLAFAKKKRCAAHRKETLRRSHIDWVHQRCIVLLVCAALVEFSSGAAVLYPPSTQLTHHLV